MEAYIFDAVFAAIILICIVVAWSKGFVQTVLSFVGFIAAAVVSAYSCGYLSQFIYKNIIEQPLYQSILKKVLTLVPTGDIISNVENIGDILPSFVRTLFSSASAQAAEKINETLTGTADMIAHTVLDTIVGPLILSLLNLILFFVLFSLLMVIVNILVGIVGKVFELPVLSGINRFLGGLIGLLNGVLICFIAASLLSLFITLTSGENSIINEQTVGATHIAVYFFKHNPVLSMLL